jgi:hypothetical protein
MAWIASNELVLRGTVTLQLRKKKGEWRGTYRFLRPVACAGRAFAAPFTMEETIP